MNWYKQSQKAFPKTLSADQMVDFILDNSLRDWSGEMDINDAKEIGHSADEWILTELPLSLWGWTADPKHKSESQDTPPIVLKIENEYRVLDGKHRIGMARARGDKTIQTYLGAYELV